VHQVDNALTTAGLSASCLTLELTESVLLAAGRSTTTALRALRGRGVGISIDDFGTGYASLRYLAELPVTEVKVDQSFTRGLPHDPTSTTIVNVVTSLAHQLGLSCVVEGIETDEQLLALPPGVLGQGYLLGKPQPATHIDQLLRKLSPDHAPPHAG
jgi:EAL domain-containing protein (putative c-di-GMP-specific phosphodiesterase class I)